MSRRTHAHARAAAPGRGWLLWGVGILLVLAAVALAAPSLAPYAPDARPGIPFDAPSRAHPLGTDDVGGDLLTWLIHGARTSLLVAGVAALAATLVGGIVGLVAGLSRGVVDTVAMRTVDVTLSLPFLPLMVVVGASLGPGLATQILVITLVIWAGTAREIRAQTLTLRERGPVLAARAMGATSGHVIVRHLLPGVAPLALPQFVLAAKRAVLFEAALSFLGLGAAGAVSWGTMLFHAHRRSAFLTDAWLWWVVPPGLAIAATVVGLALTGHGIQQRVASRARRAGRTHARLRPPPRRRRDGGASGAPTAGAATAGGATAGGGHAPGVDDGGASGATTPGGERVPGRGGGRLAGMTAGAAPLLAVERLTVAYGEGPAAVTALADVSLSVGRAERLGIAGMSGSGKSTLVLAGAGLLPSTATVRSGRVCFDGRDLAGLDGPARRRLRGPGIAFVPQQSAAALNPVMTVGAQIAEAIRLHARIDRRFLHVRIAALLAGVGLDPQLAGAHPHRLSGGMRQRAVLAIALANDPQVLVLDEPTTGLDVVTQAAMLDLFDEVSRRLGMALITVSHDLATIAALADRLVVMQDGRVVESGVTRTLLAAPAQPTTRAMVATLSAPAIAPASPRVVRDEGGEVLRVERLSKTFRRRGHADVRAVADVSFAVAAGEAVALVGPSGAGKSTLAGIIAGLVTPDTGRVLHSGRDPAGLSRSARRRLRAHVHLVFQDPYSSLAEGMSVASIVGEPLRIQRRMSAEERADHVLDALEEVQLTPAGRYARRLPHELSGGERQRVALARALVLRPRLVVADEPTQMMDAALRAELVALLATLRRRHGMALLHVTHDLALVERTCDRIVVMDAGRVVEQGATGAVLAAPRAGCTRALLQAQRRLHGRVPAIADHPAGEHRAAVDHRP